MTQVWMVRYDEGLYLFEDFSAMETSIRDMFPTDYSVEKEVISDQAVVYQIMKNNRIQDRVAAAVYDVHKHPTVIHRHEFDSPTQPFVQEKRREEF